MAGSDGSGAREPTQREGPSIKRRAFLAAGGAAAAGTVASQLTGQTAAAGPVGSTSLEGPSARLNGSASTRAAQVQELPELAAGNPDEVSITTSGNVTTLRLTRAVGRGPGHRSGQWYKIFEDASWTTRVLAPDTVYFVPFYWPLQAALVGHLAVEVTTARPGGQIRIGFYEDDTGFPGARMIGSQALDASTTGLKRSSHLNGVGMEPGRRWFAVLATGTSGIEVLAPSGTPPLLVPLGADGSGFDVGGIGTETYRSLATDTATTTLPDPADEANLSPSTVGFGAIYYAVEL